MAGILHALLQLLDFLSQRSPAQRRKVFMQLQNVDIEGDVTKRETEKDKPAQENTWTIAVVFLVIGLLIGSGIAYIYVQDFVQKQQGERSTNQNITNSTISASLIIDFGNNTTMVFENITLKDPTPYGLLMECAKPEHGNFTVEATYYGEYDSMFVQSIDGVENGNNGRYWQYYVNGTLPMVGANKYNLKNGDIVEWKYEVPNWS